ncbi:MAG: RloB family protein [Bacteroidota bacterium]
MGRKRRKPRGKKINPTLFIFCEGQTEEAYVNLLKTHYRLPSIIIHPKVSGSDITKSFIENYKKEKPTHEKDIDYLMYDSDVPSVLTRLQKIEDCTLLLSNPCIELWFLLHYKNQTASVDCNQCCKELKNRNRTPYKKGIICEKLREKLIGGKYKATERAKKLSDALNPSSTIYRLIEKLEELSKE